MATKATKKVLDLEGLKKEIPFKFKPQSVGYGKAMMVAYIDARDVQDILDDVLGPENWQDDYSTVKNNLYCRIGVKVDDEWIWKGDCGVESNAEAEKGESSDAFKRAAVKWGVGRFLYRQKIITLKTAKDSKGKERPATDDGNILWNPDQITEYIRKYKLSGGSKSNPKAAERYEKPATKPTYKSGQWSEEVIEKVKSLEKDGKKGKECLTAFLPKYSEARGKDYKLINELNTDDLMNDLIKFIEEQEPAGI